MAAFSGEYAGPSGGDLAPVGVVGARVISPGPIRAVAATDSTGGSTKATCGGSACTASETLDENVLSPVIWLGSENSRRGGGVGGVPVRPPWLSSITGGGDMGGFGPAPSGLLYMLSSGART